MLVNLSIGTTVNQVLRLGTSIIQTLSIQAILEQQTSGDYMPALLSTDPKTITAFIVRENKHVVHVMYDGEPLDLNVFARFQLIGLPENIDTQTEPNAITVRDTNSLVLDIGAHLTRAGTFRTTLIAYSVSEPQGVILWHKDLAQAHLTINAVNA